MTHHGEELSDQQVAATSGLASGADGATVAEADWVARRLLAWHDRSGRKNLPWQENRTPYRVWVSEIMLQQTQVATVIPYYLRFMARFPSISALAEADLDEVLHYWSGLGYYARARNLHRAARALVEAGGEFPRGLKGLMALPGVGRSTAGAILSLAMNQVAPVLDGNVKRVLARFHAISGAPDAAETGKRLWQAAESHTPARRTAAYTQAIMDLGATLCVRQYPNCASCPLAGRCQARKLGRVAELPARRGYRVKPVRQIKAWLVFSADRACLLERRPEAGVWGGLWVPLLRESAQDLAALCREIDASLADLAAEQAAPIYRHTFTHFHFDIQPHYLRLKPGVAVPLSAGRRWYRPDGNDDEPIGLPAPAVALIAAVPERLFA